MNKLVLVKNSYAKCAIKDNNIGFNTSINALYWKQVVAGRSHTVAIKSDGTLWAWGKNEYGQLGDGTTVEKKAPTQEETKSTNWCAVDAGRYHTVAIKSDGTIWAWGCNNSGQLGDGTTTSKNTPTQENTYATDWNSVSAGYIHTVAIKNDETLWAWGYNFYGQLGDDMTLQDVV